MSTMPLLWMFALNFFCFAASTRFDAPALTFLVFVFVFVFVRRRRDNNKELSERVFYERKKRQMRCSHRRRRVLLLNRARCTPSSSGVLFKRVDITSTPSEGKCRLVCLLSHSNHHSTRAKTRHTKTRARVVKTSLKTRRRRRTQRERERENKTHAAVILPTILFVSQRGKFFRDFFMMSV